MPLNTLPSNSISRGALKPPIELLGIEDAAEVSVGLAQSLNQITTAGVGATFNVWDDLVSFAGGSGVINYLALQIEVNTSDVDLDVRLTIDGVEVFIRNAAWATSADNTKGFAIIGLTLGTATEAVKFNESFALQIRKSENTAGSATALHFIKWSKE